MELGTADQQRFSQIVEEAIEAFPRNRLCRRVDDGSLEMKHYHAILTTIFHQTYSGPYTFARAAVNCSCGMRPRRIICFAMPRRNGRIGGGC